LLRLDGPLVVGEVDGGRARHGATAGERARHVAAAQPLAPGGVEVDAGEDELIPDRHRDPARPAGRGRPPTWSRCGSNLMGMTGRGDGACPHGGAGTLLSPSA